MSSIAVCDNLIAVANELQVDLFNNFTHTEITVSSKSQENDAISGVELSNNGKYLALITSASKQLLVYELPYKEKFKCFDLPRSASRLRFTADNQEILIADKSGDVLLYNIEDEKSGTKLLGHLSLLLDVLQTNDKNFIISSDRDEKIRVTCYPNTYNIHTYCLGHKEFVNHIELLPHDPMYLLSTSGDGHIKCWDYTRGLLCHTIDTFLDVNDTELKERFAKTMDDEGIEVGTLPIVQFGVMKMNQTCSLLAATVYSFNYILLFTLKSANNKFTHNLVQKMELESFPSAMKCNNSSLYIYDSNECHFAVFKILYENDHVSLEFERNIIMFDNITVTDNNKKENNFDTIKVLYKRKFDNVQEYQERKKQRLEKSDKCL